jgi:hypothetical protein
VNYELGIEIPWAGLGLWGIGDQRFAYLYQGHLLRISGSEARRRQNKAAMFMKTQGKFRKLEEISLLGHRLDGAQARH